MIFKKASLISLTSLEVFLLNINLKEVPLLLDPSSLVESQPKFLILLAEKIFIDEFGCLVICISPRESLLFI